MEPFSALAVATAIVQFLDCIGKFVASAYKIHTAESGTERNALREVTESLNRANEDLRKHLFHHTAQMLTPNDQDILVLGIKCNDLGAHCLEKIRNRSAMPKIRQLSEPDHASLTGVSAV